MTAQSISKEKFEELQSELSHLRNVKRAELITIMDTARALGDLKENAEYHSAREAISKNEGRIEEIEELLKKVIIIEKINSDIVGLTSVVTIQKEGESTNRVYTIVSQAEANIAEGKIADNSPIGSALLGKSVGDTAKVVSPSGESTYHVIAVA